MSTATATPVDGRFWRAPKDEAHRPATATASAIAEAGTERVDQLLFMRSLYADTPFSPTADGSMAQLLSLFSRDRVARKNVAASGVDTMHSRFVKNRPRPWIVTVGGDWETWNRARLCSMWLDGFFESADVYETGEMCVLDGLVFGTGVAKVQESDDDMPEVERVWVGELWVDPREEQIAGHKVRTLYHVPRSGIDREVLAERFPEHSAAILAAVSEDANVAIFDGVVETLRVVECWRLPLSKKCPGRHVICIGTVTLLDEEWTQPDFPFVFFFWRRDPMRFFGVGLVESLAGTQLDINELEATICESYRRMVACWLVPKGSVIPEKITNKVGAVYLFDPKVGAPSIYTPPPVSADLLNRSASQVESAFQLNGISQLSAAMMKPAGLNSGIALQNYQDVESERHVPAARSYERFYCELAKRILRCADAILKRRSAEAKAAKAANDDDYEAPGDLLTMYGGKRTLRALKYAAVMLDEKPYAVRVFPTSALAQTPAARLQQVNDMWNMGLIPDQSAMLELLNFPDLDRYTERELGGRWECDEMIEHAIEGAALDDLEVHSYMDHPYLHRRAVQMRSVGKLRGAPENALKSIDHVIRQADTFLQRAAEAAAAAAAAAQAPMPAGAIPGGPTTPPAATAA